VSDSTSQLIERVVATLPELEAAWNVRDRRALHTCAASIVASIQQLPIEHPGMSTHELSGEATAAAWLVQSSGGHLIELTSGSSPDWGDVGAAFSFTESGICQLRDATSDSG
jgi:hypothetical protein